MLNVTDEQWRPVAGYEGIYMVSDHGRIRNCKPAQRILKQCTTLRGYKRVGLCRNGTQITQRVHRLVLEAFISPCPEGMEACHEDHNPGNNKLSNLHWDTHLANVLDSVRAGRISLSKRHTGRRRVNLLYCRRRHPLTPWNTAIRRKGTEQTYCVSCGRARSSVNHARRNGRPTLPVAEVADLMFRALQAEYESRQVA